MAVGFYISSNSICVNARKIQDSDRLLTPLCRIILQEKHGDSPDTSVIRYGRLRVRNYYIVSTVRRVAQSV